VTYINPRSTEDSEKQLNKLEIMKNMEITLTRVYKKETVIEINLEDKRFKGLSEDEIVDAIREGVITEEEEEKAFSKEELVMIDTPEEFDGDSDRYDITDNNGEVYGGHL
jgi:hypothetical protein